MKLSHSLLMLFVVLLITTVVGWFVIILPPTKFNSLFSQLTTLAVTFTETNYPADLEISVSKGQVSYNRADPFCLILDNQSQTGVVFDNTAINPPLEFVENYKDLCKPLALVGNNYFIYPDDNNSFKIQPLPADLDFSLNQKVIKDFIAQASPVILAVGKSAYYVIPTFLLIALYLFFISNCFWYAFITKIFGKFFGNNLTFGQAYPTSLFVYTLLIFVDIVIIQYLINSVLTASFALSFPFFNTIVITILANLIIKSTKPQTITSSVIQSPPDNDPNPSPQLK